jgi:hypothetical protein
MFVPTLFVDTNIALFSNVYTSVQTLTFILEIKWNGKQEMGWWFLKINIPLNGI